MNINNHTLEIIVNGVPIDLYEEGVNLRINRVINDPTKISTTQAEYSFTFNLPITSTNSKAFNYANISSKSNKFSGRFNCEVYADNISIFNGTIKVTEVSENSFKCNLFKSKINTIESIFGESTMNEINWKVPFKGISTINEVNADESTKYFFPLVAYSLFNKVPWNTTASGNRRYTGKYVIDDSNRFYFNSFVPSLNLVELLKRCCELKGYQLQGDIISDPILNDIYLSNYIADEQDPLYNYGIPEMGEVSFNFNFKNTTNTTTVGSMDFIEYPLSYVPAYPELGDRNNYKNYDTAFVYSMMMEHSNAVIENVVNESKMLVNGGVQIPADGWYEITLDADFGVSTTQSSLTDIYQCTGVTWSYENGYERKFGNVTVDYSLETMPVEIQLLKYNTEDGNIDNLSHELIFKGDYPNEAPWYDYLGSSYIDDVGRRATRGSTPYSLWVNVTGTTEGQSVTTVVDHYVNPDFVCGLSQSNYSRSVAYIKNGYSWNSEDKTEVNALYNCNGYYLKNSTTTSTNYIQSEINQNSLVGATITTCTPSTSRHSEGTCKMIIKLTKGDMLVPFIQCRGYYQESPSSRADTSSMVAKPYLIEATGSIKVRAVAPWNIGKSKLSYNMNSLFDKELNLGNFNNNQQKISDFFNDIQKAFNLSFKQDGNVVILNKNKLSKDVTAPVDIDNKANTSDAEFISIDFPRSIEVKFKVDTEEEGFYRSVEDNTTEEQMQSNNWKDYGDYGYQKVNISQADDSQDISQSLNFSYNWNRQFKIEYPIPNTITYGIEEETGGGGYEGGNPDEEENTEGDGTTTSGTTGTTTGSTTGTTTGTTGTTTGSTTGSTTGITTSTTNNIVDIPVIGKTEWWIEGLDYEGYSKYDGRGLTQRMWFRGEQLEGYGYEIPVNGKYDETDDWYKITTTSNYKQYENGIVYLNYNKGTNTLLGKYFNLDIDSSSDQVDIEVFLTPMEYKLISAGASVHFDDNIYKVIQITGYDPSGENKCKLSLISV